MAIVMFTIISLIATLIVFDIINDAKQSSILRSVDYGVEFAVVQSNKNINDGASLGVNTVTQLNKETKDWLNIETLNYIYNDGLDQNTHFDNFVIRDTNLKARMPIYAKKNSLSSNNINSDGAMNVEFEGRIG